MKSKPVQKKPARKPAAAARVRKTARAGGEDHLGATEEQVGDRTGSGAGYDEQEKSKKKPSRGGVIT